MNGDGGAGVLGVAEIQARIPHRYPMLLIDRVFDLVPEASGKGVKCVSYDEPFFVGHFPGQPIMPGVLIVECMAQLAGIVLNGSAAGATGDTPSRRPALLAAANVKFRHPVSPGDRLEVEVAVRKRFGRLVRLEAWARVAGKEAAGGYVDVWA